MLKKTYQDVLLLDESNRQAKVFAQTNGGMRTRGTSANNKHILLHDLVRHSNHSASRGQETKCDFGEHG